MATNEQRGGLAGLIALLVMFAVDSVIAAPLRQVDQIRARACCEQNCSHLRAVVCEMGCCPGAETSDASIATAAKHGRSDSSLAVPGPAHRVPVAFTLEAGVPSIIRAGDDPPRTFLLNVTLRL
ncbi:MAG: hypothetical protein ACREXX_13305 [Gammaproteobacteria bacterium]